MEGEFYKLGRDSGGGRVGSPSARPTTVIVLLVVVSAFLPLALVLADEMLRVYMSWARLKSLLGLYREFYYWRRYRRGEASQPLRGDGSNAPSSVGLYVDVSRMPFGTNTTHDPTEVPKALWARWKSLDVMSNINPHQRASRDKR